ncbi:unnamed protein product, partial [Prorocentrum cordatum]
MVALVSLLRTEAGGDRAIALPPEVVRLWPKMRSECTNEWVTSMAGKWGAAVAGSSALREALVTALAGEVLERTPVKLYAVTALWDSAELGIPVRTLHLEILSHLSMRLIRERTAYAEPVAADKSTRAGARSGIAFGRVAPCAVLETNKLSQVYALLSGVKKAKLAMSTKSALIGKNKGATKEVALKFHSRDITVKVTDRALDLGIDRGNVAGCKGKYAKREHGQMSNDGRCLAQHTYACKAFGMAAS